MKKRRLEWMTAAVSLVVIGVLLMGNFLIFRNFRDSLIEVQESNLTATAATVANSLQDFYEAELTGLSLYFREDFSEEKVTVYYEEQTEVSFVAILEEDGQVTFYCGTDYQDRMEDVFAEYQEYNEAAGEICARLLPAVLTEDNHYTQFLLTPAGDGSWAVAAIEMETVYEQIVEPVQIGEYGYSMVKTYEGIILMHPSSQQIGLDAVTGRQTLYSEYDLDFTDLEEWVTEQQTNASGSRILESYWWKDDEAPTESTKIVAFTQEEIGEEIWIINCTLDYEELLVPLETAQRLVTLVSLLLLVIFGAVVAVIFRSASRQRILTLEMSHLREMNDTLEELHRREAQVRHMDKMQTLGTMTSKIAHEFNNYLTPVMLYGDLLEADESISTENQVLIHEMVEQAEKARELTRELSDYSHSGKISRQRVPLQPAAEAEHSLALLRKTMPSQVEFMYRLQSDEGYGLMGTSGMINQIVVNLCNNAVQAMGEKGGSLTVSGQMLPEGDSLRYVLRIADTGPGMSEETRKQIFTPFFTTKQKGEGTGLGLSVVQDLVHEVSGEIRVTSELGHGTCFEILLPLSPMEEILAKRNLVSHLDTCTVLILDDDARAAEALAVALRPQCREVRVFTRPEEALGEVKKALGAWDLVLTDYLMPVMSGLEFSGILRSLGYVGKIILVTGNLDADAEWYRNQGILDGLVEKPAGLADILEALE